MKRSAMLLGVALAALAVFAVAAGPAAALVPDGTHGWYWQMPQPSGAAAMWGVTFSTDHDVWSAGDGGLMEHSADAGRTWTAVPTGNAADLWAVDFVDAQDGYACGDAVLVTHDAGATWSDITPPAALGGEFESISFAAAGHGWVGTADGAVLRTTDDGATWVRRALPGAKSYVACDFVDATHGWAACGSAAWATTDGGATWVPRSAGLTPKQQLTGVDFWDRRHGWLTGYDTTWGDGFTLSTTDGGVTWSHSRAAWVTDLVATGPTSAWAISAGDATWGEPTSLLHTSTMGRSWTWSTISAPSDPYWIAARGDAVCAVGDGILVSGDAGATWAPASSGQAYGFTAAAAVSAHDIWAVDWDGALLHSTDGVRWAEQDFPRRWTNPLNGVSFPDAQHGWVVGTSGDWDGGVILHTSDGGATWAPQQSNLAGALTGVDFIDAETGWAVSSDPLGSWFGTGADTCVERTTDAGETWVPLYVASGAALNAVQFADQSAGWAVGTYQPSENTRFGALFSTGNGGLTWTKHVLPKKAPQMSGVQFLDADDGWVVGTDYYSDTIVGAGWALHTTDGGATWTRVASLDGAAPATVYFSDAAHGWIGGEDGVYATTDGGATWHKVAGGSVSAIAATDPQHVWAFGNESLISTVDASGDTAAPSTLLSGDVATWSRKPVGLHLTAADVGGSGLAGTEYRVDNQPSWQSGSTIEVPAPADHANDGQHLVYYRSTDNAGNREQTELGAVGIDTLGPFCGAPRKSVVNSGRQGILYFQAGDANSGVDRATISLSDAHGRVLQRVRLYAGNWEWGPAPPMLWCRFTCKLSPGSYRIEVRAVDRAGNAQIRVGHNVLRVVSSGAPPQRHPDWPAGLPYASGFASRQGAAFLWRPVLAALSAAEAAGRSPSAALPATAPPSWRR